MVSAVSEAIPLFSNLERAFDAIIEENHQLKECLEISQARVRELESMLNDGTTIPRQPELEGGTVGA